MGDPKLSSESEILASMSKRKQRVDEIVIGLRGFTRTASAGRAIMKKREGEATRSPVINPKRLESVPAISNMSPVGYKDDILTRLSQKYGKGKIKLPDFFHACSAFRIKKPQAFGLIFIMREAGDIEFRPYHFLRVVV